MFNSLSDRLSATFKNLRTRGKLSEADIDETLREIRRALLDADVAVAVVREFIAAVRERALGAEVSQAINPAQQVIKIVGDELVEILGGQPRNLAIAKNPPTVIMLAGLQGAGKTTLAGKLAHALKGQGHTPLLVAADLQRPNAVQQLQVMGERAGGAVFAPHPGNTSGADYEDTSGPASAAEAAANEALKAGQALNAAIAAAGKRPFWQRSEDPAVTAARQAAEAAQARAYDAAAQAANWAVAAGNPIEVSEQGVQYALDKHHSIVIVDTAGRTGVDAAMMQQAADIRAAINPDDVLFVIDAMIGQDAVSTAQAFLAGVDFTGVVLSKLDGDARGGAALSVAKITGRPIMFASTGEKITDFEVFHPDRMASRILDMGDILTLIEQAEQAFDADEAAKMAAKVTSGEGFTLADFLSQMQQVKKMGSMKKMLAMMPGMGQMKDAIDAFDDREVDRIEAIINSMTPAERDNPKLINGSRRARIARGSGTTTTAVNQLLDRFAGAQKMMRQMSRGGGMPSVPGMPNLPGMPGMAGPGKRGGKQAPKQKKGKSGNPAKRAQQEREAMARALGGPTAGGGPAGSAFGLGAAQEPSEEDLKNLQLPKGLAGLLG
ncbi:MAG: signal recognition particle protein Srp54 [Promicromonosporaceae bacterium]|nr:signal recognition particle protein Srp54 [Promicromonosporaceae bacterium]